MSRKLVEGSKKQELAEGIKTGAKVREQKKQRVKSVRNRARGSRGVWRARMDGAEQR